MGLQLKRLIKENHGDPITKISFSKSIPNLVATLSPTQANVYDNEHLGGHLDLVSQFSLPNQQFTCLCWFEKEEDVYLALGSTDSKIHILSLAYSKEITILKGHQDDIVQILEYDQDLISLAKDGTVRIWDISTGLTRVLFHADATSIAITEKQLICGSKNGSLYRFLIPEFIKDQVVHVADRVPLDIKHGEKIISITLVKDFLLTQSIDGTILYSQIDGTIIHSFKTKRNECIPDISLDLISFCIGLGDGTVLVYSLVDGQVKAKVTHKRSNKLIQSVAFSRNDSILFVGEDALIWRFDSSDVEGVEESVEGSVEPTAIEE